MHMNPKNRKEIALNDIVRVGKAYYIAEADENNYKCNDCGFSITRSGCKRFLCKESERSDKINIHFSKL